MYIFYNLVLFYIIFSNNIKISQKSNHLYRQLDENDENNLENINRKNGIDNLNINEDVIKNENNIINDKNENNNDEKEIKNTENANEVKDDDIHVIENNEKDNQMKENDNDDIKINDENEENIINNNNNNTKNNENENNRIGDKVNFLKEKIMSIFHKTNENNDNDLSKENEENDKNRNINEENNIKNNDEIDTSKYINLNEKELKAFISDMFINTNKTMEEKFKILRPVMEYYNLKYSIKKQQNQQQPENPEIKTTKPDIIDSGFKSLYLGKRSNEGISLTLNSKTDGKLYCILTDITSPSLTYDRIKSDGIIMNYYKNKNNDLIITELENDKSYKLFCYFESYNGGYSNIKSFQIEKFTTFNIQIAYLRRELRAVTLGIKASHPCNVYCINLPIDADENKISNNELEKSKYKSEIINNGSIIVEFNEFKEFSSSKILCHGVKKDDEDEEYDISYTLKMGDEIVEIIEIPENNIPLYKASIKIKSSQKANGYCYLFPKGKEPQLMDIILFGLEFSVLTEQTLQFSVSPCEEYQVYCISYDLLKDPHPVKPSKSFGYCDESVKLNIKNQQPNYFFYIILSIIVFVVIVYLLKKYYPTKKQKTEKDIDDDDLETGNAFFDVYIY